jgi:hypothetical protein
VIDFRVPTGNRNVNGPEADDLQETIQPLPSFRRIFAQHNADEQLAQHRRARAENDPAPVQLLDVIADEGHETYGLAEVIGVQQVAHHADNPISRRDCAFAC